MAITEREQIAAVFLRAQYAAQTQNAAGYGEKWILKGAFVQPFMSSIPMFLWKPTREYAQGLTYLLEN